MTMLIVMQVTSLNCRKFRSCSITKLYYHTQENVGIAVNLKLLALLCFFVILCNVSQSIQHPVVGGTSVRRQFEMQGRHVSSGGEKAATRVLGTVSVSVPSKKGRKRKRKSTAAEGSIKRKRGRPMQPIPGFGKV